MTNIIGVNLCSLELDRTGTELIFLFCAFYQQFIYECDGSRRKTKIQRTAWPALLKDWFKVKWVFNTVV